MTYTVWCTNCDAYYTGITDNAAAQWVVNHEFQHVVKCVADTILIHRMWQEITETLTSKGEHQ